MKIKLQNQDNNMAVDITSAVPPYAVNAQSVITTNTTPNPRYTPQAQVHILNNNNSPQFAGTVTTAVGPNKYNVTITAALT